MRREQPGVYEAYLERTPMFLPGEPGGKIFRLFFGWVKPKGLGLALSYLVALALALTVAFGLRQYTISILPRTFVDKVTLLPVFPRPATEVKAIYQKAEAAIRQSEFANELDKVNMVYIMPGDFFLTALVTDENRRFSDDMIERFPEILEWHQHKFHGGLRRFFKIFYNFVSQLGTVDTNYDVERLIFMRVSTKDGTLVPAEHTLDIGLRRHPEFLVDLDAYDYRLLNIVKTSENNKWGTVPMPTF